MGLKGEMMRGYKKKSLFLCGEVDDSSALRGR